MKKKTILIEANVLLTAAILILTALFVFTPMTEKVKAETVYTFPFDEGFEGATFPPADWIATIIIGNMNWVGVSHSSFPNTGPHGGTKMAFYNSYMAPNPAMARLSYNNPFLGYSHLVLTFWMYHSTQFAYYKGTLSVQVSTDGNNWANVTSYYVSSKHYNGSNFNGWAQHTVDFSAYLNEPKVYIAFLALSDYWNGIVIDDVEITGQTPITTAIIVLPPTINVNGNGPITCLITLPTLPPGTFIPNFLTIQLNGVAPTKQLYSGPPVCAVQFDKAAILSTLAPLPPKGITVSKSVTNIGLYNTGYFVETVSIDVNG